MNAVEEAVAEELLHFKELFTTVVLQEDHEAAAICDCLWENQSYRPLKSIEKCRF